MVSIKAFFAEHNAILAANIPKKVEKPYRETAKHYHVVVETPEIVKNTTKPKKPFDFWAPRAPWTAKCKPLPPMTEREMDAFNFWSPRAAKTKPLPPMTEREIADQQKFA
jgi:hypothetical protein